MTETELRNLLPPCCRIGFAPIEDYEGQEKERILAAFPAARTVVVIAHHVQDSLEWTWLKFPAARNGETSPADIHTLASTERVMNRLMADGHQAFISPYPGICGVMFKTLALPTGLGTLGDNYLFMNEDWGPWIHLRVLFTDADIRIDRRKIANACTHCGRCIDVCPAGAFRNGSFDGLACRDKMRELARTQCDGSFVFECELCLRACPVGTQPREIEVRFKQ